MTTEIMELTKRFGDFTALQSISLSIQKGEFVAILGPSGCGKSTLLRLLAGFDQPTKGDIAINEVIVSGNGTLIPPEKRNIGMVFQSFALWPHLSVQEQVEFPLRHHPSTNKEWKSKYKERALEVLHMVGLGHLAQRMPNQLSGGQRQRVALARALAHQPALLLMDEPLSSLDAELREDMRAEIQRLHRLTKSSIVYVTHDQEEALAMADRMVIMKDGQIEQVGTPRTIFLYPKTPFVAKFVGKSTIIEGEWEEERFKPMNSLLYWDGTDIGEAFKNSGTYPVRPDQWALSQDEGGIEAIVINAMYQGRELYYTVQVEEQLIKVISPVSDQYTIGDRVSLQKKETSQLDPVTML